MHLNSVDDYSSAAAIALVATVDARHVSPGRLNYYRRLNHEEFAICESLELTSHLRFGGGQVKVFAHMVSQNLNQKLDGLTYVGVGRSLRSSFSISGSATCRITILYPTVHPSDTNFHFHFAAQGYASFRPLDAEEQFNFLPCSGIYV